MCQYGNCDVVITQPARKFCGDKKDKTSCSYKNYREVNKEAQRMNKGEGKVKLKKNGQERTYTASERACFASGQF